MGDAAIILKVWFSNPINRYVEYSLHKNDKTKGHARLQTHEGETRQLSWTTYAMSIANALKEVLWWNMMAMMNQRSLWCGDFCVSITIISERRIEEIII